MEQLRKREGKKGKPVGRVLHGWLVTTSCKTRSARLLCVVVPSLIGWVRGKVQIGLAFFRECFLNGFS